MTTTTACKLSDLELRLKSFASLLSSAQATGLHDPLFASFEPALSQLLSPLSQSLQRATIPSLSLQNDALRSNAFSDMTLENIASLKLAIPMSITRDEAGSAPVTILNNISDSFMTLVDARLRSSILALHGQKTRMGDHKATKEIDGLTKLLMPRSMAESTSTSSPISLQTVVTSFRVLPPSEEDNDATDAMVLPLVFETIVDISAFGKMTTVAFRTAGTITGSINPSDLLIDHVEVLFDSSALLQAMRRQARHVVKKTIAIAAGLASKIAAARVEHAPFVTSMDVSGSKSSSSESLSSKPIPPKASNAPQHEDIDNHNLSFSQMPMPRTLSSLSEYQKEDIPSRFQNEQFLFTTSKKTESNGIVLPEYSIEALFRGFDSKQQ